MRRRDVRPPAGHAMPEQTTLPEKAAVMTQQAPHRPDAEISASHAGPSAGMPPMPCLDPVWARIRREAE